MYVPSKKYVIADALSRKPRTALDNTDDANDVDLDNVVDYNLFDRAVLVFARYTSAKYILDDSIF